MIEVSLTIYNMKHYIPELMNLYKDMLSKNWINEKRYEVDKKKHFSDSMLHSIISIINRLNNNHQKNTGIQIIL